MAPLTTYPAALMRTPHQVFRGDLLLVFTMFSTSCQGPPNSGAGPPGPQQGARGRPGPRSSAGDPSSPRQLRRTSPADALHFGAGRPEPPRDRARRAAAGYRPRGLL